MQQLSKQANIDLNREIESVCLDYNLAVELPTSVIDAATQLASPNYAAALEKDRRDLRNLPLITIDGADARDFDDALHCRSDPNGGYALTVVIADVSNFVKPGDMLDDEAINRTTSVYFPGKVLPMLPPRLSEDWCSLRPQEDRFGLACSMSIAATGEVTNYEFFECVMRSRQRLTYTKADSMIQTGQVDDEVGTSLQSLAELTRVMEKRRSKRGGLQLEVASQVMQVADGEVLGFTSESRLFSHRVVEECMLAANTSAAAFLARNKYPFLYRVHDKPDSSKAIRLQHVMREFGVKVRNLSDSRNLQHVIDNINKQPTLIGRALTMNILRTLQRAQYTPRNVAHYGLGYDDYTHFTSPIRRYPDLLVHRAIKDVLRGNPPAKGLFQWLLEVGATCSEREMYAERAALQLNSRVFNKLQSHRIGEAMVGVIVGMSKGGFFVMCADGLEGMVKFSTLRDDFYELNQHQTKAIGKRRKRCLTIGMEVHVALDSVDPDDGRCKLLLVD